MRRRMPGFLVGVGVCLVVTVSGCSGLSRGANSGVPGLSSESASPSGWATPTSVAQIDVQTAQWTRDLVTCLNGAGWDAQLIPPDQGGWGVLPPPSGGHEYDAALQTCLTKVGELPDPVRTRGLAEQSWDRQMEIYGCLKAHGFADTGSPPSEETWVAQFLDGRVPDWSAYSSLAPGASQFAAASKVCPQDR